MKRVNLFRIGVAFLATLGLVITASAQERRKPNVVVMMADNLGYGDVGCYGGGEVRGMPTPRIDKLASEGLRFTQFLVEPGCTPSRAAFMTGRYSIRSGLSLVIVPGTPNTLVDKEITLAEVLKTSGYTTAMYGKWHLGYEKQSLPHNQGFDDFYGILNTTDETLYVPTVKLSKAGDVPKDAVPQIHRGKAGGELQAVKPYTLESRKTIDLEITELAIKFINENATAKKPFFLFLPWTRPHYPNVVTKKFKGKSRIGMYGDSVMELDHNTGRVLDALNAAGVRDNTIVVFISDNGPMRDVCWPDSGSAGPFRGELGDPTEGSIRTIGMIRWPGKIKPGKSNEMISIMDVYPTIVKMAGAKMPQDRHYDGVDQTDFLTGKVAKSKRKHLLTFVGDRMVAARWKQFRTYFVETVPTGSGPSRQPGLAGGRIPLNGYPTIYHIERDPREEHNVNVTHGWVLGPVMEHIAAYKATLEKEPNPQAPNLTAF
jgi:arylsulfatase